MQLPAFFVLPKTPLDCDVAADALVEGLRRAQTEPRSAYEPLLAAVVLVDQAYQHLLPQLRLALEARVGGWLICFWQCC